MIQEEILFNIVVTESTCLPYGSPQRTINIEFFLKKKKVKRKELVNPLTMMETDKVPILLQ